MSAKGLLGIALAVGLPAVAILWAATRLLKWDTNQALWLVTALAACGSLVVAVSTSAKALREARHASQVSAFVLVSEVMRAARETQSRLVRAASCLDPDDLPAFLFESNEARLDVVSHLAGLQTVAFLAQSPEDVVPCRWVVATWGRSLAQLRPVYEALLHEAHRRGEGLGPERALEDLLEASSRRWPMPVPGGPPRPGPATPGGDVRSMSKLEQEMQRRDGELLRWIGWPPDSAP